MFKFHLCNFKTMRFRPLSLLKPAFMLWLACFCVTLGRFICTHSSFRAANNLPSKLTSNSNHSFLSHPFETHTLPALPRVSYSARFYKQKSILNHQLENNVSTSKMKQESLKISSQNCDHIFKGPHLIQLAAILNSQKPDILCASELSVENPFEERLISNVIPQFKLFVDKQCPRIGIFMNNEIFNSSNTKIEDTFYYDEVGEISDFRRRSIQAMHLRFTIGNRTCNIICAYKAPHSKAAGDKKFLSYVSA